MIPMHDRMDQLENLTSDYLTLQGIQGIVFDLDDTLVPEYAGFLEEKILAHIKLIAKPDMQVAIVTNNFQKHYCQRIIDQLHKSQIDILIVENAFKPFPFSLKLIETAFGLPASQIALVGDGILTDRLGAALSGYRFIQANWFPRPFYKHPILFCLRELLVIGFDWMRFLFLNHRPQLTWLLADNHSAEKPQRKFLFLINPDSSHSDVIKIKTWIREIFDGETDSFYIHVITRIRNVHRMFGQALQQGKYTHVVVAGGDGTVREAITLIANNNPKVILGILPTGTGNLLAKALNIPLDAQEALKIACNGAIQAISITRVNNTYATLIAGMGVDAEVMAQTSTQLKKQWGALAYIFSAINVAFARQKSVFWIRLDGKPPLLRRADGVIVVQRNQFGRAFLPIDLAGEDEASQLDVCILKSSHWLDIFNIIQILFRGQYDTNPEAMEHYTCQQVHVSAFPPRKVQVDGDTISATQIDARVLKDHILMSIPSSPKTLEEAELQTEAAPLRENSRKFIPLGSGKFSETAL